jgi:hypothetical protein
MADQETIYLTHDNASHLVVKEQGQALASLGFLTRVLVSVGSQVFDSNILDASHIWWTDQVEYPEGSGTLVDVIKFKLGDQAIEPGTYLGNRLVLCDAQNINGVVFTDQLKVVVK